MKRKKKVVLIFSSLLLVLIFACVLYVRFYPYAAAESEDGMWKAYLIATTYDGSELINGLCDGVLVYQGNREGEAENVRVKVECDGEKYSGWDKAVHAYRGTSSNLTSVIEKTLVRKDSFYWFSEFIVFSDYDTVKVDIRWEDEDKTERYTSIELNVKEAREQSIPLFEI